MEVFLSGEWGTVSHDGAYTNDARVVCRQLGYSTSSECLVALKDKNTSYHSVGHSVGRRYISLGPSPFPLIVRGYRVRALAFDFVKWVFSKCEAMNNITCIRLSIVVLW